MPLDPSQDDFKYWAFISYSHADDKWADWLHKGLETYKVPKHLVGKPSREGMVPSRPYPVFRDRDELPGSANLGDNLEAALRLSRYLIVVCSPNSVASKWVDKEIRMFKSWGREDRVLCLIVDGEPNASARPELGLKECLPEAVRFWVDQTGKITEIPTEPIAADARKGKDGKKNALLKLLAGILGVNFDDLKQRDFERKERQRKMALAGVITLLTVFSGLGIAFYFQKNEAVNAKNAAENERLLAESARAAAEQNAKRAEESRALEEVARKKAEESFKQEAIAKNEAVKQRQIAEDQRKIADEQRNLAEQRKKIAEQKELEIRRTLSISDLTAASRLIEQNEEGKALAYLARALHYDSENVAVVSRAISLLSQRNWALPLVAPIKHPAEVRSVLFTSDGKKLITIAGSAVYFWNSADGTQTGTPLKHAGKINTVRLSADGTMIVTASDDGTAQVWDVQSGKKLGEALQHKDAVTDARFSKDGKLVATVSQDKTARVWKITGEAVTPPLEHPGPVLTVLFSPDAQTIVTSSQNAARIWSVQSGAVVGVTMKHEGAIYSAEFSPNGQWVATGSLDGTARLWDAITGVAVGQPMEHQSRIYSMEFSPDGRSLLTACVDGTARVWDVVTSKIQVELKHEAALNTAMFSPNGQSILTTSVDGTARVWSATTGEQLTEQLRHHDSITHAEFSPDGRYVATASKDGFTKLWSVTRSTPLFEAFRHERQVNSAVFSPDRKYVATASADRSARIWNFSTGKPVGDPLRNRKGVLTAVFSPDSKLIATGGEDFTAQVWDVETGHPVGAALQHNRSVDKIIFTPDSKQLITASDDGRARLWDAQSGAMISELKHDGAVTCIDLSKDGKWLLTGSSDRKARVWNLANGQVVTTIPHNGEVSSASFSSNGKWVVTGSEDKTARVSDAMTGKEITAPISHESAVKFVCFAPDAGVDNQISRNWILTATDKIARIWEAESGKAVTEPMQHEDSIRAASFSPEGAFILTAAGNFVRVWDSSGKLVADPFKHDGPVRSATFGPEGNFVLSACADGTARAWFFALHGEAPAWLRDLATAVGGYRLDNFGAAERVTDSWDRLNSAQKELGQTKEGPFVQWGRWYIADRSTRAISPFTVESTSEYIAKRVIEGSESALAEALELQPSHALALAKLSRFTKAPERADFLSRLAQDYEPNNSDVLWLRAQVLQQLDRASEALVVMEKAIQNDPRNIPGFGPNGSEFTFVSQPGALSSGWLPAGWFDFSNTPFLNVTYTKVADAPVGLTAIEMKITGADYGQADLRGQRFICKKTAKCTVEGWIRSPSKSDVSIVVSQFIEPFQKYKEQTVHTSTEWKPFKIQFSPTQDIAAELRVLGQSGAHVQLAGCTVTTE